MVPAVVPELELEGGAADGLPQDLVAHADAEHGLLPQQRLHVLHDLWHRRRVALCNSTSTMQVNTGYAHTSEKFAHGFISGQGRGLMSLLEQQRSRYSCH